MEEEEEEGRTTMATTRDRGRGVGGARPSGKRSGSSRRSPERNSSSETKDSCSCAHTKFLLFVMN